MSHEHKLQAGLPDVCCSCLDSSATTILTVHRNYCHAVFPDFTSLGHHCNLVKWVGSIQNAYFTYKIVWRIWRFLQSHIVNPSRSNRGQTRRAQGNGGWALWPASSCYVCLSLSFSIFPYSSLVSLFGADFCYILKLFSNWQCLNSTSCAGITCSFPSSDAHFLMSASMWCCS